MNGALEGIKVVDMGHFLAIPAAGAMMADWGAEVIKVEPLSGEALRVQRGKIRGAERFVKIGDQEVNWQIQLLNRNKKGLALDLRHKSGIDILYKLIKKSDVFMSNFESKVLERFGLDYDALSRLKPDIIYAIVTSYGTVGPDKDRRGFDYSVAWAGTGAQQLTGEAGITPPLPRPGIFDRVVGSHVVNGILAALLCRGKTGGGQKLEFSLYHSGIWSLATDIQGVLMDAPLQKDDRTAVPNPLSNTYRTRNDRWFMLAMPEYGVHWPYFIKAIEKPELEHDPRFSTFEAREHNCRELIRILDEVFAQEDLAEWEKRFKENNCIYGRIQTAEEVITDPQAMANAFFADVLLPAGKIKIVTTPVKFGKTPAIIKSPAPEVGQHTDEILQDLGYNQSEIARLREQKVIL